jgi:hypothetical protein
MEKESCCRSSSPVHRGRSRARLWGARYDAFRLEVSPSYRELFDRELKTILEREKWKIVALRRRTRARRRNGAQLELKLN